jgi:hypothetical protein
MKNADSFLSSQSCELTDFGPTYFDHVLAEFELIQGGKIPPAIEEVVRRILEKHQEGARLTWGDLYLLEKYVIQQQPAEVVKARLLSLRFHYREIAGATAYEQYLKSGQATPLEGAEKELRADAERLLDALHWAYAIAPEREKARTDILKSIFFEMSVSAGMGIAGVLITAILGQTLIATVILVLLLGALGGFLSVQQRIQKIPSEQDPILTMFELQNGRFAVRLAPLTGAICALVLFLIFQAGLLKGALFPDMGQIKLFFGRFAEFPFRLTITEAQKFAEFGKLLVWCFIAGFAERLVPDTLDNLVAKRDETKREQAVKELSSENTLPGKSVIVPVVVKRSG